MPSSAESSKVAAVSLMARNRFTLVRKDADDCNTVHRASFIAVEHAIQCPTCCDGSCCKGNEVTATLRLFATAFSWTLIALRCSHDSKREVDCNGILEARDALCIMKWVCSFSMSSPETMLESEVVVRLNTTYSRVVGLIAECPENRALRYDCKCNGLVNSTWRPKRNDTAKGSTVMCNERGILPETRSSG
jgi:hypothetical protein